VAWAGCVVERLFNLVTAYRFIKPRLVRGFLLML
jgi:hypothetical protein